MVLVVDEVVGIEEVKAEREGGRGDMAVEQLEDPLLGGRCKGEREALEKMKSLGQFVKEVVKENKRLWYLAGPAIFTSLAQYSLGATTQVFAGHLTTLELDAVSTQNMVIAGLAFGLMVF